MPKTLAESHYNALIEQIADTYHQAKAQTQKSVNLIITQANWKIGQHIVQVEQKQKLRAEYGDQLIERLSKDLSEQLGPGFSVSNLKYMRRFYLNYKKGHARAQLPWTHYRSLLTVKDPELRGYYEKQASEHNWSSRDLDRYLKLDNVEREHMSTRRRNGNASPIKPSRRPTLTTQRGQLFHYMLKDAPVGKSIQSSLMIDCGFQIFKEMCYKKSTQMKHNTQVMCEPHGQGYAFTATRASRRNLYTYKAVVDRIVDGDTLLCWIDVGFETFTHQRLRLRRINCPELNTERGQKARLFVQRALRDCDFIIVKTYRSDKYDRYLTDIFYDPSEPVPARVAENGQYLNAELVNNNLATIAD